MKKLRLDMDALVVESFSPGQSGSSGTVRGHATDMTYCENDTCNLCPDTGPNSEVCGGTQGCTCTCQPQTCKVSCFDTCAVTCGMTGCGSCTGDPSPCCPF